MNTYGVTVYLLNGITFMFMILIMRFSARRLFDQKKTYRMSKGARQALFFLIMLFTPVLCYAAIGMPLLLLANSIMSH